MQASISNRTYPVYLLFSFLMITIGCITSCTKDENVERDYPRVNTIEVTSINASGILLSAKIISGDLSAITEYGFVWSTDEYPYADEDDKQFKTGTPSDFTFSENIQPVLKTNETYYVRAYVKTDNYLVHGNIVSFKKP